MIHDRAGLSSVWLREDGDAPLGSAGFAGAQTRSSASGSGGLGVGLEGRELGQDTVAIADR